MGKVIFKISVIFSIFAAVTGFNTYYNLQKSENIVFNAWSDLDVSFKTRSELIPNLVNTTKEYMQFEKLAIEDIITARDKATTVHLDLNQLSDAEKVEKFVLAQEEIQNSLARLLVVVERYPELKSNQNFLDLQHELQNTENKINFATQKVNMATRDFNYSIREFPGVLVNKLVLHLKELVPAEKQ